MANVGYPVRNTSSKNLDEHLTLIKGQVDQSLRDGETRQLAVKIVSDATVSTRDSKTGQRVEVIKAWGKQFRAPEASNPCASRDDQCEIWRIWDFVNLNFRYVYDPAEVDTFATAELSLDAGGGDCDDATILFAALLKGIGFHVAARVIGTGNNGWEHVYPIVAVPKDANPHDKRTAWVPLDMTMDGAYPGWQYEDIARHRDYLL